MAEQWQIQGKNCLVTGGASGIGAKKVEALLKDGAEAVAFLDINETNGKLIADDYNKTYPGKVTFIQCDMADEDSISRAFNQVVVKLKRIDVIINNAGIINEALDEWGSSVDVNLVIERCNIDDKERFEPHEKDEGGAGGAIVNVSSVGAFLETASLPIYCATKSGIMWFGRSLATGSFYEDTGIRILTIFYGATETSIMAFSRKTFNKKRDIVFNGLVKVMVKQSAESAANACMEMIKRGANGSLWLSQNNEPAKEFTDVFNTAYESIRAVID